MPSIARLEQLGVARVSTASGPSLVAMSLTQKIAQDLHEKGEFDVLESSMKRIDAQQLFATRRG
jgi:2-methylisocitrate lyase-like PEP mutase family enzyme